MKKKRTPVNVPEQLELPFPKVPSPTNKETLEKKKTVYAHVPPFTAALAR